jgi:transposase-like protein
MQGVTFSSVGPIPRPDADPPGPGLAEHGSFSTVSLAAGPVAVENCYDGQLTVAVCHTSSGVSPPTAPLDPASATLACTAEGFLPSDKVPNAGGGPRTAAGKLASRGNALKHGMAATTLLPRVLQPGRLDWYRSQLSQEYQPQTITEEVLVAELARHAAALDVTQEAEGAVLRHSALELAKLILTDVSADGVETDALLAASVSTEALLRFSRYRRAHEKGFLAALARLSELRDRRPPMKASAQPPSAATFADELACENYLAQRFQQPGYRCPHCGHPQGSWLAKRRRWQCDACRRQVGVRTGTVTAESHVALVKWFAVIEWLVAAPATSSGALAQAAGIRRIATVRKLATKVRAALAAPHASQLLAGLDRYFRDGSGSAEPTVLQCMNSAKRTLLPPAPRGQSSHG